MVISLLILRSLQKHQRQLCAVVIPKLGYQYRVILKFINDTMLVINAARPIAGQTVL
jgi:hypothetical protein